MLLLQHHKRSRRRSGFASADTLDDCTAPLFGDAEDPDVWASPGCPRSDSCPLSDSYGRQRRRRRLSRTVVPATEELLDDEMRLQPPGSSPLDGRGALRQTALSSCSGLSVGVTLAAQAAAGCTANCGVSPSVQHQQQPHPFDSPVGGRASPGLKPDANALSSAELQSHLGSVRSPPGSKFCVPESPFNGERLETLEHLHARGQLDARLDVDVQQPGSDSWRGGHGQRLTPLPPPPPFCLSPQQHARAAARESSGASPQTFAARLEAAATVDGPAAGGTDAMEVLFPGSGPCSGAECDHHEWQMLQPVMSPELLDGRDSVRNPQGSKGRQHHCTSNRPCGVTAAESAATQRPKKTIDLTQFALKGAL